MIAVMAVGGYLFIAHSGAGVDQDTPTGAQVDMVTPDVIEANASQNPPVAISRPISAPPNRRVGYHDKAIC